jgi:outer membrane protein TolC
VLAAQETLYGSEDRLMQSQGNVAANLSRLCQALGGEVIQPLV